MIKWTFIGLLISSLLGVPGYAGAEVKIYLDEERTRYVMAEELDCNVYEEDNGITIGFKLGNMLFGFGPELKIGGKNRIKWEKTTHAIIARYKELCARFNSGSITMKEYNDRISEIDKIAKDALEFQENQKKRVRRQASDAFDALKAETEDGGGLTPDIISGRLDDIGLKVRGLYEERIQHGSFQ